MNRLLTLLLCAPLCAGGIPRDKSMHAAAGAIAYVTVYEIAKYNDAKHPKLYGIAASVAVGALKEYYDHKHPKSHTCEFNDFAATALGGITISYVWKF